MRRPRYPSERRRPRPALCRPYVSTPRRGPAPPPTDWYKGRAVGSRIAERCATVCARWVGASAPLLCRALP